MSSSGRRLKSWASSSGSEFAAISNQGLIAQSLGVMALSPTQEEMIKPLSPMTNAPSPTQLLQSVDPFWRPQSQQLSRGNVSNVSILPFSRKPGSRTPVLPSTNNMSPFSDLKPRTPAGNAVQLRQIGQPRLLERRQGAKGIVNPVSPGNPSNAILMRGQRKTY